MNDILKKQLHRSLRAMGARPTFSMNDPVTFRRHMGAHCERGIVKGRTFERQPRYEIETSDGERIQGAVDINLDEQEGNDDAL